MLDVAVVSVPDEKCEIPIQKSRNLEKWKSNLGARRGCGRCARRESGAAAEGLYSSSPKSDRGGGEDNFCTLLKFGETYIYVGQIIGQTLH